MLTPVRSTAFRRDVKRAQKRGKDMARLRAVLMLLLEQKPLPESLRDHPLKGAGPDGVIFISSRTGC